MQDWQERVIAEEQELAGKITRLSAFINSLAFQNLDSGDQALMLAQKKHMEQYQEALVARIERFPKDEEPVPA